MGQAETKVNEPNTLKISECKPIIRKAVNKKRPVFIWGPPGSGKSDMVDQVANEFDNSLVIDMRMALMDPTDIKGVPYKPDLLSLAEHNMVTEWSRTSHK